MWAYFQQVAACFQDLLLPLIYAFLADLKKFATTKADPFSMHGYFRLLDLRDFMYMTFDPNAQVNNIICRVFGPFIILS